MVSNRQGEKAATVAVDAAATAALAHDVNNLIAVILLTAEDLAARCTAEEARLVAEIVAASNSAAAILRKLNPRATFDHDGTVEVNAVVMRIAPVLERLAARTAVLTFRLDANLPHASVDPVDLERALVNLVSNAGKAVTAMGHIAVVTRRAPEGGLFVAVEDDGAGMDEATRARAVEPFFSTSPLPAKGLGLAGVADAVRRAGGRLDITSSPGAGTRVEMWFPAAT